MAAPQKNECCAENNSSKPVRPDYDGRRNGVRSQAVAVKYKCNRNEGAMVQEVGSTLPLVETSFQDLEAEEDYNPFENRELSHPTSDWDTLVHLLKGSLGNGILAMPLAIKNAGLATGFIATLIVGAICTYCVHILVKSAHELCKRRRVPSLGFAETAEAACLAGPLFAKKYSRLAKALINTFLVIDLLGCCCVYIVFVGKNIKQVVDHYTDSDLNIRLYMVMLLPLLIPMNMIRKLKYLAPLSMIANVLIGLGVGITFYYILTDLPPLSSRPNFAMIGQLPLFFGTAIFALEGIGVVMPLENNMKTPTHFTGCPGVLNIGMSIVVSLYAITGFFGYLKYGDETEGSITLNLPKAELLAQSVKIMIAVAIFFTYSLQFYVPMEIIWKELGPRISESKKNSMEYVVRVVLVISTVLIAVAIPNLGPFISLIGAVCLSLLGLIFPALIDVVTFWDDIQPYKSNRIFYKNMFLVVFGVIGLITGTYVSVKEIALEM